MKNRRGFTLVELLITVAIIAILAAIAIPNFLAAQTRAKVSRVKSDLRTIGVGLESYYIDNNHYPPDAQFFAGVNTIPYLFRLKFITTPIGYLTSIPTDPFAVEGRILEYTSTKGHNPYALPTTSNNWVYPLTYDYANRMLPNGGLEPASAWANISANPDGVMWGLRSVGPDLWPAWLGESVPAYDPTNGTISEGNIYWTGPGRGEDAPRI